MDRKCGTGFVQDLGWGKWVHVVGHRWRHEHRSIQQLAGGHLVVVAAQNHPDIASGSDCGQFHGVVQTASGPGLAGGFNRRVVQEQESSPRCRYGQQRSELIELFAIQLALGLLESPGVQADNTKPHDFVHRVSRIGAGG